MGPKLRWGLQTRREQKGGLSNDHPELGSCAIAGLFLPESTSNPEKEMKVESDERTEHGHADHGRCDWQYYNYSLITGHEAYMKAVEKERFERIREDK